MSKLAWSDNEELFSDDCDSVEEAIDAARDEGLGYVYVGRKVTVFWADFLGGVGDAICDLAGERAYEFVGEAADGFPDETPEQRAELAEYIQAVVTAWADRHGLQPKFYRVVDTKRHEVPELTMEGE